MSRASEWWNDWSYLWWEIGQREAGNWWVCTDCGGNGYGFHACTYWMQFDD